MLTGIIEHLSQTTAKNPYKSKIISFIKYLSNTDLNFFRIKTFSFDSLYNFKKAN